MDKMTVKAYAKINIGLDVTGKTDNGYHLLKSIMQQVDLYDYVTVEKINEGIVFECNSEDVPSDDTNLAVKAAKLMKEKYGIESGIKIILDKRIPVAAGMAGGSTDGAAVITGINEVWNLGLSLQEMIDTGVKLGADIPFCILGGCALAEGIGEKLTKMENHSTFKAVIAKPPINVSTKHVYQNLKLAEVTHPDMDKVIEGIKTGDNELIVKNMGNVLATVTENDYEIINILKKEMLDNGADGSLMSGSGPTVFGLFSDEKKAESAESSLKKLHPDIFVKMVDFIKG